MPEAPKFRISVIGSGPIGKLLLSSVAAHPRIEYTQYEAETLPLRPAFGYGIGPQTLATTKRLNPAIYQELHDQCLADPGEVFGRIGRDELMVMLDAFGPRDTPIQYGRKLKSVKKSTDGGLALMFEDGGEDHSNALWACDGMNSLCRKFVQGEDYIPASYSGHVTFRGKVESSKVEAAIGKRFTTDTSMFLGIKGWHVLTFPIAGGKYVNIAAFSMEEVQKKRGRNYVTTTDELLTYFPGANSKVRKFLTLLNDQPGGCVCLELTHMQTLGTFTNQSHCMTSFGDAANGMLPHIGGSMATGFIGVTTFLHEELNPRIHALNPNASNAEIAEVLMEASIAYERKHKPLAQKLVDYSREQGFVFSGGVTDAEELARRARFLWKADSYNAVI
ncbi:mannitol 1-phosphate dehydrogenase [Botrytis cinerea]